MSVLNVDISDQDSVEIVLSDDSEQIEIKAAIEKEKVKYRAAGDAAK